MKNAMMTNSIPDKDAPVLLESILVDSLTIVGMVFATRAQTTQATTGKENSISQRNCQQGQETSQKDFI